MIKVTLEFPNIAQAHAVLGTLMVQVESIKGDDIDTFPAATPSIVEPPTEVATPKKKRTRKKKAEPGSSNAPAVQSAVDIANAASEAPAPARKPKGGDPWGGTLELQTIRAELTKYSQKHGFKAARDILKEFEIKRIPELQERLYPAFLERLSQTPPPEVEEASDVG